MGKDTPGKTVRSAKGKAKAVLFTTEDIDLTNLPDGVEVVKVEAAVVQDQVQRRT